MGLGMTNQYPISFLLVFSLLAAGGCSPYVHSPPGRTMPLETAKALNKGETGVQVEGGGGVGGELGFPGVTARVRHGVGKGVDVNAEFTYLKLNPAEPFASNNHQNLFSGRVGFKYAPLDWVALVGGLAGGGWTGGGYLSPDLSLILSWENPYFVPALSVGGYTSHPLNENAVAFRDGFVGIPDTTIGWTTGMAFRIPISHVKDGKTKSAFLVGIRFTGAAHDEPTGRDHETYLITSAGFEFVFD